eukprot:GFKZ01014750.1.p1 GENE.GFKZ01014750.1~~GFKZ01014750.1.p1  ORF type:complete len:1039 (+),score=176.16 GFKZ01014750.1:150-3119(+)
MALPSSIRYLPRRAHVFSTAAVVYLILKLTSWANRLLSRDDDNVDDAWAAANTRAAKRILRTATARRGLWIKCCQYVAARQDALPPEYGQVLSKSLDDCPPSPAKSVLATVNHQLAQTKLGIEFNQLHSRQVNVNDLFDDFDPANPIASASIAQVHTATLKQDGRQVVLKVQHPGVRPMLLQDLEDLKTLLRWIAGAEPKYDMRPVLDAWIEMVPRETNFLNEMRNLQAVKATLDASDAPHLAAKAYVPEPLPELTSDKLFVMEYINGCKVSDYATMDKHAVDRERLVTEITRSFGNQLFIAKVFSGDPHPGNFLVHKLENGGEPVLLDFGICVNVKDRIRMGFAKLILAAINNDSYSLIQSLGDVGVQLNRADPVASLDIIKFLFRTTASREQSREEQQAIKKRLEDRETEIEKNERDTQVQDVFTAAPADSDKGSGTKKKRESRSPIDSFPGDLVFFFRSLGMLRGLATSLDVRHSYLETLRPFAEHALLTSCPQSERATGPVLKPVSVSGRKAARAARILEKVFAKLQENDMMIGMQVAAYKNGKLVLNMAAGQMGRYNPRPVHPDSVFNSFSSTKGLSSILFASIQDEHEINYDDLVKSHWPEYGTAGKEETTVRNILSHSAGLARSLPADLPMTRLRDDWQGIIKHLEQARAEFVPGSKTEYHALTFGWLVAGLIQKVTGKSYQDNLQGLVQKLGIEDECYCGTMPEDLWPDVPESRVASLSSSIIQDLQDGPVSKFIKKAFATRKSGEGSEESRGDESGKETEEDVGDLKGQTEKVMKALNLPSSGVTNAPAYILDTNFFNHPVMRAGFVPSANGHFSARALAKLYGAVANDGVVDDVRVLAAGRAAKMQEKMFDIDERGDRSWGAGLTLYDAIDSRGRKLNNAVIGHGGIGGSMAFAVPSENFAMAVTLNKLNAVSISAAMVISVICKAFDVPTPVWYHMFANKARMALADSGEDGFQDESSIMDKVFGGDAETDVMKMLVG